MRSMSATAAFSLSLLLSFSTAYAVELDPASHRAVPGDFNGDSLVDELLQPLHGSTPSGIFFRDAQGKLSIPGQVWKSRYLGFDWDADSAILHPADFRGTGRSDLLLQPRQRGASGALLFATPDGRFLDVAQVIPDGHLGLDWSAQSHVIYTGRFDGAPQNEVLLQAVGHRGINGIVHTDASGHLTQLVETWPAKFLGIPWDAATVTLYIGDFNADGQDDVLVQMKQPARGAQAYYLLLADPAGKFSTIKQSWGVDAFGGDWDPATHKLSVQTLDGVTSLVLTATHGGSNYVFQANAAGTFDAPAAKWKGPQSAAEAFKSKGGSKTSHGMSVVVTQDGDNPPAQQTGQQGTTGQALSQDLVAGGTNPVDSTGESSGSGGVSGGAGTYSIPLALPPGIAGMQPALSINYSSKGGNGDLGMGWSLSGLSAIHRCPSTQAQDGLAAGVDYSSSDRLCLDGQHLIAVHGSYGADNAIYRTELDSGVLVMENGAISSSGSTFEVDYQDGRKAYYGAANGVGVTVVPVGAPAPLVWDIGQQMDLSGNNILYSYQSFGYNEYHIVKIAYTGQSTPGTGVLQSSGSRVINFSWTDRGDFSSSYLAGGVSQETQLLTGITVVGGSPLREYDLAYAASSATNRSLLQSVQECGYDSAGTRHCLPATTFDWQNVLRLSSLQPLNISDSGTSELFDGTQPGQLAVEVDKDYFGDGRKAIYDLEPGPGHPPIERLEWQDGTALSLDKLCDGVPGIGSGDISEDFNDDGKADVSCTKGGNLNIVSLSLDSQGGVITTSYPQPISTGQQLIYGDFTGDGLEDVLTAAYPTDMTAVPLLLHSNYGRVGAAPHLSTNSSSTVYHLQVSVVLPGTQWASYVTETASNIGDLDGNGIPDLLVSGHGQAPSKIVFIAANSAHSATGTTKTFTDLGLPDLTNPSSGITFWKFIDINGDGLQDFVFISGNDTATTWKYQLNHGDGTFAGVYDTGVAGPAGHAGDIVTADIDNDGQAEFLVPDQMLERYCYTPPPPADGDVCNGGGRNIYSWQIFKFFPGFDQTGAVTYAPAPWGPQDWIKAPVGELQTGDVYGDGLTTVFANFSPFYANGYFSPSNLPGGYQVYRNTGGAPDLMTGAHSGLGRESDWQYKSLTDLWVGSVPTSAKSYYYTSNQDPGEKVGCTTAPQDASYYCFTTSMYVVSDYKQSNETGGLREYRYGYQDAVYNGAGRGFQGFYSITEFDMAAWAMTTTTFHQDFPLSGKPYEQDRLRLNNTVLSKTSYAWQQASSANACYGSADVLWAQPKKVTAQTYDLGSGNPYITTVTSYVDGSGNGYDANGNNTYQDVLTTDYTADGSAVLDTHHVQTTLTYKSPQCSSLWTDWVSSKQVTSTVTYDGDGTVLGDVNGFADGSSITRNATYTPDTTGLRKLGEEDDDAGTSFEKDMTYAYDGFGNLRKVTVATPVAPVAAGTYGGLDPSVDTGFASRSTTTTYTADGYFVAQVKDPLGHVSNFESYDLATGQPTSVLDANGVQSTFAYDAFGRKVQEDDGPMPVLFTSYSAPGDGDRGSAPAGTAYAVNAIQLGYPAHTVYYDLYGKPLREAKDSDRAGVPVLTDTAYDDLGRPTSTTEPYFDGDSKHRNTVDGYDAFNRPTHKTDAEGVGSQYGYSGLTTTVTTTPGDGSFGTTQRVDVETRSSAGKLLSVENAQGAPSADGTTQFRYDAQGNPVLIQDAKGDQTVASYNLLGQKTRLVDPDMGTWTYAYDALGQMLQQTDAKGQVTMQAYDLLGRMTSRIQPETQPAVTAIWCYDGYTLDPTAPAAGCTGGAGGGAIGKLSAMGQSDGYSELYTFDSSGRPVGVHTSLANGASSYDTATRYDARSRIAAVTYPGSFPDTAPVVTAAISGSSSTSATLNLSNSSVSASLGLVGTAVISSHVFDTVYKWSVSCVSDSKNGPQGNAPCGTFSDPGALDATFTTQNVGTYVITLTVTDGFLVTASNTINVTVLPGLAGRPGLSSDYQDGTTSIDGKLWTSWGAGAGATYYKLYQSKSGGTFNGGFSFLKQETSTSDAFTDMGSFTADYTYQYEVQSCDDVTSSLTLCSAISAASGSVLVTYPIDPISGQIVASSPSNGDGSFDVSWTAPDVGYVTQYTVNLYHLDAETHSYEFERVGCVVSGDFKTAAATSCHVTTGITENGEFYHPEVQPCNVSICAAFYPDTPSGAGVHIVYAPTGLKVTPATSTNGNLTLSWTAPPYLTYTSYEVYHSFNNGAWIDDGAVSTTSKTYTGQQTGSYRYFVTGCPSVGACSAHSATATGAVAWKPGTPLMGASVTSTTLDGRYNVHWSAGGGDATQWTLQEEDQNNAGKLLGWNTVYQGNKATWEQSDALYTSSYRVEGCNSAGCSAWSGVVSVPMTSGGGGGGGGGCTGVDCRAPNALPKQPVKQVPPPPVAAISVPAMEGQPLQQLVPVTATLEKLAALAEAPSPSVVSMPRHVAPRYALPVYRAYAGAHLVKADSTQVMAGLQVAYHYTTTGYVSSVTNALSPADRGAFWTLGSLDAYGHVLSATYGNGDLVTNTYGDAEGRITNINTVNQAGTTVQNDTYRWYAVGNLASRQWQMTDPVSGSANPLESFSYDVLSRLSGGSIIGMSSGPAPASYAYDVLGNITCKSDVTGNPCSTGSTGYSYGGQPNAGPHAVTSVAGTVDGVVNPTYGYDQDGNLANRAGTNVVWNSLNLPTCMDAGGGSCGAGGTTYSAFSYAPDKHRYQQVAVGGGGPKETTTYVGGLEIVATDTSTDFRHRLSAYGEDIMSLNIGSNCADAVETVCFRYIHGDQLGGVDAVTDLSGQPLSDGSFGYDAFGQRRDPITGAAPTPAQVQADRAITHRGFTGHEMLDNLDLVHMNGRVYDPALGRFLSVDPVFQAPTNMQSLNPYSYVLNNPLSLTDPSGYDADAAGGDDECGGGGQCPSANDHLDSMTGSHINGVNTGAKCSGNCSDFVANAALGAIQKAQAAGQTVFQDKSGALYTSNGQENQRQGPDSTLAVSQDQAGGVASTVATQTATLNGISVTGSGAGAQPAPKPWFDGNLDLTGDQKNTVLQMAGVPYDPASPTEAFQLIRSDNSQTVRSTDGCVENQCPAFSNAVEVHWHVNVANVPSTLTQAQANMTREFPGPGDAALIGYHTVNVGVTPMGAVWAIPRVNGKVQLEYLQHSSNRTLDNFIQSHWQPGMSDDEIANLVKGFSP